MAMQYVSYGIFQAEAKAGTDTLLHVAIRVGWGKSCVKQ